MTVVLICAECTCPFDEFDGSPVYDDDGRPMHRSCRDEFYERHRLADEREAEAS